MERMVSSEGRILQSISHCIRNEGSLLNVVSDTHARSTVREKREDLHRIDGLFS